MALRELAKVATNPLASYGRFGFVSKLNKFSHTPPHYPSSWANSRTSFGMLWCVLHHRGPQAVHHDILSRWCPSSSLPAHRVNFVCTTIIHFANESGTWLHFKCFASPLWQMHPDNLLVQLPFEVSSLPHTHSKLMFPTQHIGHNVFPSWACVECPHSRMPMCLATLVVLMTTWVKWQSTSRSHCRSRPPHPWSLCNGPKS
jgi:hypothetical protein